MYNILAILTLYDRYRGIDLTEEKCCYIRRKSAAIKWNIDASKKYVKSNPPPQYWSGWANKCLQITTKKFIEKQQHKSMGARFYMSGTKGYDMQNILDRDCGKDTNREEGASIHA